MLVSMEKGTPQDILLSDDSALTPLQKSVYEHLSQPGSFPPPDSPYDIHNPEILPIICEWILHNRIDGKSDTSIQRLLVQRLGIARESAESLMSMAHVAGEAAADVEDHELDPDQAVDRLVHDNQYSESLATDLVNMGINLFHDALDASAGSDEFEMGVESESGKAYLAAADYVIDSFEAGRCKKEIIKRLIDKSIFTENAAAGFVEDVMLAEIAAERVNEGEEGTTVFEDLKLQEQSPYVMMLALHLIKPENK